MKWCGKSKRNLMTAALRLPTKRDKVDMHDIRMSRAPSAICGAEVSTEDRQSQSGYLTVIKQSTQSKITDTSKNEKKGQNKRQ
jgi:hypothetical protein